jgi:hypothetical protein
MGPDPRRENGTSIATISTAFQAKNSRRLWRERTEGGPWRDVTAESIERNKRAIATYEAILNDVRTNPIKK